MQVASRMAPSCWRACSTSKPSDRGKNMIEFRKYASARLQTRCYLRVLVISVSGVALGGSARQAMAIPRHFPPQDGGPNSDSPSNSGTIRSSASNEPWPDSVLQQPDLPAIPKELVTLYEKGNVQYVFYDPARYRRRFAAETQFSLDYVAKSTFRWRFGRGLVGELCARSPPCKPWLV